VRVRVRVHVRVRACVYVYVYVCVLHAVAVYEQPSIYENLNPASNTGFRQPQA